MAKWSKGSARGTKSGSKPSQDRSKSSTSDRTAPSASGTGSTTSRKTDSLSQSGSLGYFFREQDDHWRLITPYSAEFRDAITKEIPSQYREFDWVDKTWIIAPSHFDDAFNICRRFFAMTQLFTEADSEPSDSSSAILVRNLRRQLAEAMERTLVAQRNAQSMGIKVASLQAKLAAAGRSEPTRISDHSGVDCLAAVKKNYPLEAMFHLLPSAPNEVLRSAYRALSQLVHPDKHPQRRAAAEADQKRLNLAYGDLSKRRGM